MNNNGVGCMSLPSRSNETMTTRQKLAKTRGEQGNYFNRVILDSIILTSFVVLIIGCQQVALGDHRISSG